MARYRTAIQIAALLLLAHAFPPAGLMLQAVFPVKELAVVAIFVVTGITLRTGRVVGQLRNVRLHALVQSFIFLVFPLLIAASHFPFDNQLDGQLAVGLYALASLPTTISSCVAFTTMAGGNTAGTLFNAVFANIAGIVLSPLIFLALVRAGNITIEINEAALFWRIAQLVVFPFAIGQLLRRMARVARWAESSRKICSRITTGAILLIVYLAFCSLFRGDRVTASGTVLIGLLAYLFVLNVVALALVWWASGALKLPHDDRISALFTGSQKTLAMGWPLIMAFCADSASLRADVVALPIIFYHPMQLVIASLVRDRVQRTDHSGGGQDVSRV